MRRRLTPFVQVAFGLLASHLLLAQHVGLGGSNAPAHFGGQVHAGPPLSLPSPVRPSGLPSEPMAMPPGVRYPSLPIHEGAHPPSHRPDDGRRGVEYRNHTPYT